MEIQKKVEEDFYSYAENNLALELSIYKKKFPEEVIRQYPIGDYYADFFFPHLNLVLEIDGKKHNDFEQYQHDIIRDKFMIKKGYTIVRISGKLAYENPLGVINILKYFPKGRSYKINSESDIGLIQRLSIK